MKLSLCLITLLSVAPLFTNAAPERVQPNQSHAVLYTATAISAAMRAIFQEISDEEDEFWSLPIEQMQQHVGIQPQPNQAQRPPNN